MNVPTAVSVVLIAAFALILPRSRMGFPVLPDPPSVTPPDLNGGSVPPGGEPGPQVGDPPVVTPPDLNGGSDPPGGEPGDEDRDLSGDYDDPGDDPGGQYDEDSTWDIPDSRGYPYNV